MSRRVPWLALVGAGLVGLGLLGLGLTRERGAPLVAHFQLTEVKTGTPFTEVSLRGRPTALFFGFTYCPDVCPTALATAGRWLDALGPDAEKLRFVFVTVDPERDTAEQLSRYLSAFDARIQGLTGPRAQVEALMRPLGVFAQKTPVGESYVYDHTSLILLLDSNGLLVDTVDFHDREDQALADLRAVLAR
jgi:protein SCO1/2